MTQIATNATDSTRRGARVDGLRTVERALAVLDSVCDTPGQTLSSIADAAGLPVSSTLRILRSLQSTGHITRTAEGRYVGGPQMIWLGGRVLANSSLRRACRPGMQDLAEITGESVFLSALHSERVIYLDVVRGRHIVRLDDWEGQDIPAARSAAGRCLTGECRADEVVVAIGGIERDVAAMATPIVIGGTTVAALSIVLPEYRLTPDRQADLTEQLLARARLIAGAVASTRADRAPRRRRRGTH